MASRRKITVSSSSSRRTDERESEFQSLPRPSVFSRLGKRSPSSTTSSNKLHGRNIFERHHRQRDDQAKPRKRPLHGSSPKVDTDWQNWNEESLDYEDERMLEKKRLLLQRELEKEHEPKEAGSLPKPTRQTVATAPAETSSSSSSSSSDDSSSSTSSGNSSEDENVKSSLTKRTKKSSAKKAKPHKRSASSAESEEGVKKGSKADREMSKKSVKKKSRGKETKKQSKRKKVPDKKKESTGKRSEQHSPTKSSKGGEEKPTPIVDKFGFYHSQQLAPSSSSAAHEGASKQGSDPKRSTSADRRQPVNSLSTKKRKRRSSGSPPPPRKRKTSPSKSKQSYIAATSRSGTGSLGKGGDRDLRERRTASRKKPSLSPQRSSRRKAKGQKKAQLTGANSEPVDNRRTIRRPSSPADRGLRRNRSRSDERLLPPQTVKITPKRPSSERSSTKSKRTESQRSPVDSQKCQDESEGAEVSATEDFSEIGESDEELLNQHNEEQEQEEMDADEETENVEKRDESTSSQHDISDDKLKESDLLEGISEEELDVSDEEKDQKVKIADALGVDWSQLITPKESKKSDDEPRAFRNQWTPAAIFSRIGLPRALLGPEEYEAVIKKVNEQGNGKVEILHPIPTIHCYLLDERKKDSLRRQLAPTEQKV